MNKKDVFLIVGGDLRQTYLAEILAKNGKVYTLGLDKNVIGIKTIPLQTIDEIPELVDYLILPLPVTNDGVNVNMPLYDEKVSIYSLVPLLKHNSVVFGGKIGKESSIFTYKGFEVIDYLEREELTVLNAVPMVLYKLHI